MTALLQTTGLQIACAIACSDTGLFKKPVDDWLPAGCSGNTDSVIAALDLKRKMIGAMKQLIVYTEFACISADAGHIRLGDVVVQSAAEPSDWLKAGILNCVSSTSWGNVNKAISKFGSPDRFRAPTTASDVRQAAGDRKEPVVHWIPATDAKLVEDTNETGDLAKTVDVPVILVGCIVDYKGAWCPSYENVFQRYATLNAGVVLANLVSWLDNNPPSSSTASLVAGKWPPVAAGD